MDEGVVRQAAQMYALVAEMYCLNAQLMAMNASDLNYTEESYFDIAEKLEGIAKRLRIEI